MGPAFYIAQAIGVVNTVIVVISAQFREMKYILICQIIINLMVAASSALLGGFSGAWISAVATVQAAVMYFLEKKNLPQKVRNIILALFAVVYVGGTAVVYQGWGDLVSCTCALLFLLAIIQTRSCMYRRFICLNTLLWLVYDLTILAFGNMITHGVAFTSAVIGILRLDIRKNGNAEELPDDEGR